MVISKVIETPRRCEDASCRGLCGRRRCCDANRLHPLVLMNLAPESSSGDHPSPERLRATVTPPQARFDSCEGSTWQQQVHGRNQAALLSGGPPWTVVNPNVHSSSKLRTQVWRGQ